jgi:hypothetical protein
MKRKFFFLALLLTLVGGFVVAQQSTNTKQPAPAAAKPPAANAKPPAAGQPAATAPAAAPAATATAPAAASQPAANKGTLNGAEWSWTGDVISAKNTDGKAHKLSLDVTTSQSGKNVSIYPDIDVPAKGSVTWNVKDKVNKNASIVSVVATACK